MASAAASSGSPVSLVKTVLADSIKPASTHPLKVTAPGGSEASLLLVKGASGELYATVNKCTHYGLPLAGGTVADCSISCPFHGAQFDLRTGDIEDGPAFDKLPVFPVTVQADGFAYVALPADGPVPTAVSPAYCHARPTDGRHFVVVGAGAASHAAVEELRKRGFEGRITVFSKESAAHHYDRTVLSKNMAAGATPAKIQLRPEEWWGARGVELRLGTEVTAVDPAAKTVTTSAGETVPYDACLCATSGPARTLRADRSEGFSVPGAELGGVFVCREPADSAAIAAAVKARPRPDVVVIGSSFIGMEAAAAIATSGKLGAEDATVGSVTVVGMEAEPFERVLGPDLGAAMRALHEARGVSFRMGTSASAMAPRPDDAAAVGSVTLKDGSSLPADVVVVGAGIIPALGYLESAAGVEVLPRAGGVKVDSRLRAAEDLFVCGDIARFPYAQAVDDSHRELRLEHWDVAIAHGRTAARNMLGDDVPFDAVPFFWSGQLGKNIRYAGNAMRWDEALVQGSLATPKATVFYCCGDKVAAVATLQDDPQAVAARDLMRLGKMPSVAQIKAEAKFDLAAYLKKATVPQRARL
ncbi:hypothetical protein FNF31_06534 [Cafeteria roenbergensis]|uniref:Rieske domain-containing protein n=1 Tax=Cafeteria roenbergensis TaxID=33653 RepID=A0A5A8CMK1_CAFRO|nr:hypothetical protein FNF31_06534 [Cafeteria roenbergensis]KAA0164596.1 hypothetical protein FNF28_03755 [Cafeteria roenbergensis]